MPSFFLVLLQALVSIDVEDLEVDATPEDLMLSYVSGEKGKVSYLTFSSLHDCRCMPMMCSKAVRKAAHVAEVLVKFTLHSVDNLGAGGALRHARVVSQAALQHDVSTPSKLSADAHVMSPGPD